MVWLLVGLMAVPLVALGADGVQRGLESGPFPSADVHVGERFVYDVTVVSDFQGAAATARRHIEVRFGENGADAEEGVMVVRTDRRAAPWDPQASPPPENGQGLIAARRHTTVLETIDSADGRVLYRTDRHDQERWYGHEGETYRDLANGRTDGVPWREHGVAFALGEQAAVIWRPHVPLLGLHAASPADANDLPLLGTYRDRPVYGRSDTYAERFPSGGAVFGCELALPPVVYQEHDTAGRHAGTPVVVSTERVVWRDPDLALPVAVDCQRTFRTDEGIHGGRIRVAATLVEHDPGGDLSVVPWGKVTASLPAGSMVPRGTVAPGVPADAPDGTHTQPGGAPGEEPQFRFPLGAADLVARALVDRDAADFTASHQRPYALLAARYWPGAAAETGPCAQIPERLPFDCGVIPPSSVQEPRAFVEPLWQLTYGNAVGSELVVQVLRNMTTTGQVIEDVSTIVASGDESVTGVLIGHVPERLVPVHTMLAAWLHEEGLTVEGWRAEQGAHFAYELQRDFVGGDRRAPLPVYSFRHGEVVHPDGPRSGAHVPPPGPRQATTESWFGASDGVLIRRSVGERQVKDAGPPAASAVAVSLILPEEQAYRPMAAAVVGVVGLGAVAVGATPQGRGWLRGLVAAPLFARRKRDGVLDHPTRDGIVSYVTTNPGAGTEEIRRHLLIGWGTAVYHLSALEQKGLLASIRQGGSRHWFAAGHGSDEDREALALLRSASARRVHEAIRRAPGRTQKEVAMELGVSHAAVSFHVRRLARVGLVREARDGRSVRYFAVTPSP